MKRLSFSLIFITLFSLIESVKTTNYLDNKYNSKLLFTSVKQEYFEEQLKIVGKIPDFINGTIYRNGFGKFEGNEFKLNHLFDAMSLILKFDIIDGNVYFKSRLLNSNYYNDSKKGIPLYRTLGGTTPEMNMKQSIETKLHFMQDNLNANLIIMNNKLFAISDLAGDIVIDKTTLEYQGKYKFINQENENIITSAHPERWLANRNIIVNYETDLQKMVYKFYYINATNNNEDKLEKRYFFDIPTKNFSYVHSFSLTQKYIIFIEYPVYCNIAKIVDSVVILPTIKWDSNSKTKINIIDLSNKYSKLITIDTEPFFSFHHINAFDFMSKSYDNDNDNEEEDIDNIFVELITYEDSSIFDSFYMNNLLNDTTKLKNIPGGNYSKIIINLDKKRKITYFEKLTEKINGETIEMPTMNQNYKGTFYKYFYAFTNTGKIIKVDVVTGAILEWFREGHIPSEPIFIPFINHTDFANNKENKNETESEPNNKLQCISEFILNKTLLSYSYNKINSKNEDNGVVVSVVLDTISSKSYLLFLDAKSFLEIAKAEISTHIPLSCHGLYDFNF
jgi:beta,beta-carotene 9',10'-dioxygenase